MRAIFGVSPSENQHGTWKRVLVRGTLSCRGVPFFVVPPFQKVGLPNSRNPIVQNPPVGFQDCWGRVRTLGRKPGSPWNPHVLGLQMVGFLLVFGFPFNPSKGTPVLRNPHSQLCVLLTWTLARPIQWSRSQQVNLLRGKRHCLQLRTVQDGKPSPSPHPETCVQMKF